MVLLQSFFTPGNAWFGIVKKSFSCGMYYANVPLENVNNQTKWLKLNSDQMLTCYGKITEMMRIILCAIGIILYSGTLLAQETQLEINQEGCRAFNEADKKLNSIYQNVLKSRLKDVLFIKNLKSAQKAWLQFRNLHLDSIYPPETSGSIAGLCRCDELEKLTLARIEQLEKWITYKFEEGDVCAGTWGD